MKLERRTRGRKVTGISPFTGAFIISVLVFSSFSFVIPVQAQFTHIYTVKTTADIVVPGACGNGSGNSTGDCSLRGAITAVNAIGSGDISFAIPASDPFCTAGVCTINLTSALPALSTNNIFINGPGADKLIVKPATGVNVRIFNVAPSGTVGISGLTISNGSSAIGSGIANSGTVNINNCVINGNIADQGGGIYNLATLTVSNSTITGNTAAAGSGINHVAGTLNVINSTISGNTGTGAGIKGNGGTVNVTNSTITGNSASGGGGGITNSGSTVNVKNTIIALNLGNASSQDVIGNFVSAGFNLIARRDGSSGFTAATDQTGTIASPLNPMLDPAGLRPNGGPTLTIALLTGSPAIDKGSSLGLTGSLTTDQRGTGFLRTFDNRRIVNASGGNGTDIGALERRESPYDFDGDGKTDVGIFRPGPAEWWINRSFTGATFAAQFGASMDRIVPGDYTGDGRADIAVWRPGTGEWFVLRSEDFSFFAFPFGTNGDVPMPADYDADGKADPAVFRPSSSIWFIRRSSDAGTTIQGFGAAGDLPVVGDYDGDGLADIAIYRASPGQWWLNRSTAGVIATTFGGPTDKPVQGDYTGDGKTDMAFWRPSTGEWFVLRSENFSFFSFPFGTFGDIPSPGDYDGDGRFDATVFRPSQATWFVQRSTAGTQIQQFGANGDRPIPNAFVP